MKIYTFAACYDMNDISIRSDNILREALRGVNNWWSGASHIFPQLRNRLLYCADVDSRMKGEVKTGVSQWASDIRGLEGK